MSLEKVSEGFGRFTSKQPKKADRSYTSTLTKLPLDDAPPKPLHYIHAFNPTMTDPRYVMAHADAKFLRNLTTQLATTQENVKQANKSLVNFWVEKKMLAQENAEKEVRNRHLAEDYRLLKNDNLRLVNEVFHLQNVQAENARELQAKESALRKVQEENASLHFKYWKLKDEFMKVNNEKLPHLTWELQSLRRSSDILYKEKMSLAKDLEQTKVNFRKAADELNLARQTNGELLVKEAELASSKVELQRELSTVQKVLASVNKQIPFYQSELDSLKEEKGNCMRRVVELQKQIKSEKYSATETVERLNRSLMAFKNQLDYKNVEMYHLQKKLEANYGELSELKQRSAQLELKNRELESQNVGLEYHNVNLERQNAQLKQQNTHQLIGLAEVPELKIKLRTMEQEKDKLDEENEKLYKQFT